jgi:hypothetical protein
MTHDDLQDCLDKFDCAGMVEEPLVKALRAIVELHKPKGNFADTYVDGKPTNPYCPECIDPDVYPCPTIKAIEKELA